MAASDYLNEMRRYFENNSRTKDFVAHTAKVCKNELLCCIFSYSWHVYLLRLAGIQFINLELYDCEYLMLFLAHGAW